MTFFCECELVVGGPIEDRLKFKENVAPIKNDVPFDFSLFEQQIDKTQELIIFEPYIKEYELAIKYIFKTTWSPPKPLILIMSKMFPNLKFTFRFRDNISQLQGTYTCKGGQVIHNAIFPFKSQY